MGGVVDARASRQGVGTDAAHVTAPLPPAAMHRGTYVTLIPTYGGLLMTLMSCLVLLLVAGICGAIGQAIAGYRRGGLVVAIALGFIGALLGT